MSEKTIKWVITGEPGSRILLFKMPGGNTNLVLHGLNPDDFFWQAALESGFHPTKKGDMLYRNGGLFTLTEIRKIFPRSIVTELPEDRVYLKLAAPSDQAQAGVAKEVKAAGKAAEKPPVVKEVAEAQAVASASDRSAAIEMSGYTTLGVNYLGQEVHEDSVGNRFVVSDTSQSKRISEKDIPSSGAFLRAEDDASLALCADGFVLRMVSGSAMGGKEVSKFSAIVYGEAKPIPDTDIRLRRVQEAIEAAVFRYFAAHHREAGPADFNAALAIEEMQPVMKARTSTSVELQQYSTPLSMSVAAQSILTGLITKEDRLLEPSIGNASLVSTLDCEVFGYDIDPVRAAAARQMNAIAELHVEHRDFLTAPLPDRRFDAVISNPPFGGLDKKIDVEGLQVSRLDHLFLMKSLQMRKDEGVSVYIIGGDAQSVRGGQAGKLEGGSANLFNWLADHYEFSAFEIDGSLFAKQGANFPVRMIAVGKRVSKLESAERRRSRSHRITELPVVKTSYGMWEAAQSAREFLIERGHLKVTHEVVAPIDDMEIVADVNEFQVAYVPSSAIGEASSVVPINLAVAQRRAFERLTADVGNVDGFVAKQLQLQVDDLAGLFTPEQVDAIALGIWNIQRGRGLILGDATGQGKGRVMAAMSLYAVLSKKDAIFVTEKPNLFSDLWRDIVDIGANGQIKPLLVNQDSAVIDFETGNVIHRAAPAAVRNRLFGSEYGGTSIGQEGYTTMFSTYSQFNRPASKLNRARWLAEIQDDSIILLDESHNAAGESNTGYNIAAAIARSAGAIYSSATFAKDAKNFRVYGKAFPPSVNLDTLEQTLEVGGEQLMEVLSSMLTEDGVMVCRQADISNLEISTTMPSAEISLRNRELSAKMSEILLAMSNFSGDVSNIAMLRNKEMRIALEGMSEEQRKGNRMGVTSVNFGSRLYNINRQFLLAIAMDTIIERALTSLRNGEKPVLVVEQTMESVLNELLSGDEESNANGDTLIMPLTFRDLLKRMLDKVQTLTVNNGYGKFERVAVAELSKNKEERDAVSESVKMIGAMIDEFPDLPCNPLDNFRNALEAQGWKTGEISGRSLATTVDEEGNVLLTKQGKVDRAKTVFDFNFGKTDALVITRAGSTGLSLHSSEKFKDQRRRRMIEGQICNVVDVRIQFFGRVNRRGQTSTPAIESVTSGLPCEVRNLSMQNSKLRRLSASTTSNRNNKAEIADCPDILNWVGNQVCLDYLMENPEISNMLGVELDREDEEDQYFVNRLTGYIMLLHPDLQDKVFSEIFALYNDKMMELSMKGENPFEEYAMDVKGRIVESFTLSAGSGDSVFDAPVQAEKLEWEEDVEPMRFDAALERIKIGAGMLAGDRRFSRDSDAHLHSFSLKQTDGTYASHKELPVSGFLTEAARGFADLMERSLPKHILKECGEDLWAGVKIALAENGDNIVQAIDKRRKWMNDNLRHLTPMHQIIFTYGDEPATGLITELRPPDLGMEHYMGQWAVRVAIPGKNETVEMSLNQLMNDEKFEALDFSSYAMMKMRHAMDQAPSGKVTYSRWVLTGNLFAAAEIAATNHYGRAGIFTDQRGLRHRAILCRSYVDKDVLKLSRIPIATAEEACEALFEEISTGSDGLSLGSGFSLSWHHGQLKLVTPGSKAAGGKIFLDSELLGQIGVEFSGSRKEMEAHYPATRANVLATLQSLYRTGITIPKPAENDALPVDR